MIRNHRALTPFLAWRVDFNLSLASFETAIGGTRSLVDLALSSPRATPPRVLFTSSVGIFRSTCFTIFYFIIYDL